MDELDLIALAYETAMDPERLPDLLSGLLQIVGADAAIWLDVDIAAKAAVEMAQAGMDHKTMLDYATLSWDSPMAPRILATENYTPVTDEMLMPRSVFQESQFFQRWVRPSGLTHGMFGNLASMQQEQVVISLMRSGSATSRSFDEKSMKRFGRLLPHLDRATSLKSRIKRAGNGTSTVALDMIQLGVFCLNEQGRVLGANSAAERLMRRADGLSYNAQGGLGGATADATAALQALFKRVAAGVDGAIRLNRPSGALPLSLIATLCPRDWVTNKIAFATQPQILLFVSDPSESAWLDDAGLHAALIARLCSVYKFTLTEATIALLIYEGRGLPFIARELDLSVSTIRTHTKHIFFKASVHNQVQLTRVISGIVAIDASELRQSRLDT